MKKVIATAISIASVVLIIIAFGIATHYTSANGYYSSIEQLRAVEKEYNSSTIIYTQEMADRYVDFIIDKDDNYWVIQIEKRSTWLGQKYRKGVSLTKPMSALIRDDVFLYDQSKTLNFMWLSHLFSKKPKVNLLYCVAHGDSEIGDETVKTVPFTYKDKQYLLCLKFEVNE